MKFPPSRVAVLIGLAALSGSDGIALGAVDTAQFAVGWPLELPSDGRFFDVPLTHEVYSHGKALEQLAVIDDRGEPMPFYLAGVPSPAAGERRVTLGVSPIYTLENGQAAALGVATDGEGTDGSVTRPASGPEAEVAAFVVDARDIELSPIALELEWRALEQPFLLGVSVAHSEDLTSWRSVGRGSVASLEIDGNRVSHGRIPVAGRAGGYYRVTWDRRVADWALERVVLIASGQPEAAAPSSAVLAPLARAPDEPAANALYFDVGGRLPTVGAELVFPDSNRWTTASLEWGNALDGPWRRVADPRLFYDIDYEGEPFVSAPLEFFRIEARYWRVRFYPEIPAAGARLKLAYPEERLRFAANGEPPYMLVGGTLSGDAGPDPTLAALMRTLEIDGGRVPTASLAGRIELGGEAALRLPYEFPWRTAILWAALCVAIVAVGGMAVRLAREMFNETG